MCNVNTYFVKFLFPEVRQMAIEEKWVRRGEIIQKARIAKELKQSDVAEMLGKSVSAISSYELGTRRPNLDDTKKLCDILDIDIAKLI